MRVLSYGGGVQSTALLVLAATGRIDPIDAALFANVGDRAEHPGSLAYVRDVARPYAAAHGIELVELRHERGGEPLDLYDRVIAEADAGGATSIPLRGSRTGAPSNRTCTADHKVRTLKRWLREHGASKDSPADVLVGFSTDEWHRATNGRDAAYERRSFPLLDLGLSRSHCQRVIADAGLPVPGKSSCWFCPFHTLPRWATVARDEPDLFARACDLEDYVNARRGEHGRDPMYLTFRGAPLREVVSAAQDTLPFADSDMGADGCDEGACWT